MVTIVAVAVFFTAFNILMSICANLTLVLVFDMVVWTGVNVLLTRYIKKKKEAKL